MDSLKNKRIAIDSMIIIYLLEQEARYFRLIGDILTNAEYVIFSTLLLGEVLAGFYRKKTDRDVKNLMNFIQSRSNLIIQDFDLSTAIEFAHLRAETKLTSPDCVHIASALIAKADLFLTNDRRVKMHHVLPIIYLDKLATAQ